MNKDTRVINWIVRRPINIRPPLSKNISGRELFLSKLPKNKTHAQDSIRTKQWKSQCCLVNFLLVRVYRKLFFLTPILVEKKYMDPRPTTPMYSERIRVKEEKTIHKMANRDTYARKEKTISLRLYDQKCEGFFDFIKALFTKNIIPKTIGNPKQKEVENGDF